MIKLPADLFRSNKKLTNFTIYGFGQAFNLLGPLLVIPFIVKNCGETGYGKVALGISLAFFLILIVDYAFEIKGVKEASEKRNDPDALRVLLNKVYQTKAILCLVALSVGIILINSITLFSQEKLLFYLSLAMVVAQAINPVWFHLGVENLKAVTFINILSKILYISGIFIVIRSKEDYVFVNLLLAASSAIAYIAGIIIIKRQYGFTLTKIPFSEITDVIKLDFNICLSQLFLSARQQAPVFLSGYFLGYFVAGQYKILENIVMLFRTLIQVLQRFFYPTLCYKLFQDLKDGLRFWKTYSGAIMIATLIGVGVMYMLSTQILIFFKADIDTISFLRQIFHVALAIPALMSVTLPIEQLMFGLSKNKEYVRITIGIAILNIILILILIKPYGLKGIISSICITEIIFATMCIVVLKKKIAPKNEY